MDDREKKTFKLDSIFGATLLVEIEPLRVHPDGRVTLGRSVALDLTQEQANKLRAAGMR